MAFGLVIGENTDIKKMRTLWFFKPVNDFPEYLICSDGVVYREGIILKVNKTSRQGYDRIQFRARGLRVLRSVTFLLRTHFKKHFVNVNEIDCPF